MSKDPSQTFLSRLSLRRKRNTATTSNNSTASGNSATNNNTSSSSTRRQPPQSAAQRSSRTSQQGHQASWMNSSSSRQQQNTGAAAAAAPSSSSRNAAASNSGHYHQDASGGTTGNNNSSATSNHHYSSSKVSSHSQQRSNSTGNTTSSSRDASRSQQKSSHRPSGSSTSVLPNSKGATGRSKITQAMIAKKWRLDHVPTYRCDEKGYIHFDKGLLIKEQYVLMDTLGRGTFSKVFEAIDIIDGQKYALKVIRNSHRYIEAAKTELRVLEHITNTDDGRSCCIHLRDHFSWNEHPCFLFKLFGPSIYAVMSKNHYRPFPDIIVRELSLQICNAIQFLHHLGIIFTDLKPENIVFVNGATQCVKINGKSNYLPRDTRVKIVDFGSAVYEPRYDPNNKQTWKFRNGYNYLIQTRHYRAPEVVLEMHWKRPVDVWSIGCVILEFLYGSMVFNTHCPIDHLNQMQKMIGPIPKKLIECASDRKYHELFKHPDMTLNLAQAKRSRAQAKPLQAYYDMKRQQHVDLWDLVKRMLQWFSEDRIKVDDIMRHRYWETSDPDYKESKKNLKSSAANGVPPRTNGPHPSSTNASSRPF